VVGDGAFDQRGDVDDRDEIDRVLPASEDQRSPGAVHRPGEDLDP